MVAANGQAVAIAGHQPDIQFRVGQLYPGGKSRCPAMDGVKSICGHIIGEARRAADAGDENDILRRRADIREGLLHPFQDRIVTATGAPANFLIRGKILGF